ncbi:MAG: 5'(3')-deoxyribonucleotidase [Ferruginibacter sp.]
MKRISVDMDGVLANVYSQFVKMHAEEFGQVITAEEMSGKPEGDVFPEALKYVNSPGFFRTAPLMENCQRILERLNDQYRIFIVSAAMEFPNSLVEKQAWLNEYFPFISWHQMVFCGSKEIIKADIMIDDHFKNLNIFTGDKTILFTQPHNVFASAGKHQRVDSWDEIEKLLLG